MIPLYSRLHRLRRYYICSPLFPELHLKKPRCKVEENSSAVCSVAAFFSFSFRAMFSRCNQPLLSAALEPCVGTVIRPLFVSSFRGMFQAVVHSFGFVDSTYSAISSMIIVLTYLLITELIVLTQRHGSLDSVYTVFVYNVFYQMSCC